MIYVYVILLTAVYLINSQVQLSGIVVFVATTAIYFGMYMRISKRYGQLVSVVAMMIVSLPFSWNPIWGGAIGTSILTWYYLWMGIAIFLAFSTSRKNRLSKFQAWIVALSVFLIAYSFIPLILSVSIAEGFKEFVMIGFFLLIMIAVNANYAHCDADGRWFLTDLYIYTSAVIGTGMILQYVGYKVFGKLLFGIRLGGGYGGRIQTGCTLLMEDASSGTIMLGAGVILALVNRKRNKAYLVEMMIIAIGLACSGRRTAVVSLLAILVVYFILGLHGIKQKLISVFLLGGISAALLYFMYGSRATANVAQILDDNGRFQLYREGLRLFRQNPLLGHGFDNNYLARVLMPSRVIVHNTVIRWLDMGGIFYGLGMVLIVAFWIMLLKKKGQTDFMWCVLYSFAASMFIPDVLNARFLYAIALISIMSVNGMNTGKLSHVDERNGLNYEDFHGDNTKFE